MAATSVIIDLCAAHARIFHLLTQDYDADDALWYCSLELLQLLTEYTAFSDVGKRPIASVDVLWIRLLNDMAMDHDDAKRFVAKATDAIIIGIIQYLPRMRLNQITRLVWLSNTNVVITYEEKP